jgi:hypothetical protein
LSLPKIGSSFPCQKGFAGNRPDIFASKIGEQLAIQGERSGRLGRKLGA